MTPKPDTIEIRRLKVSTNIGVPDKERDAPQDLFITVSMVPSQGFDGLIDNIERTIDYHTASIEIQLLAAVKPRKLIETLGLEIADHLLKSYAIESVDITIEKRILPNTDCVAVHLHRARQ